ncbi:MAG: hypothetical protein LZF62_200038 [Nitrospira sp.]|nr:MAG: hypothetical protein LZF62_200038 [Nitrospira sp.]
MTLLFRQGEIDDEFSLRRKKSLPIDLHDPVTVLLKKLQDPSVEIVAFLRDIGLNHARGQYEARARDVFLREACFKMVMGGQVFLKLFLLLLEEVLIRTAIADAKYLNRFAFACISKYHLDPCPFIQQRVVHVGRKDRGLPSRLQKLHQ